MHRLAVRAFLVIALVLAASTAWAENWKTLVQQAGGFWAGDVNAPGWSQKIIASNAGQALGRLPAGVQTMLKAEIVDNPWIKGHEEMKNKLGKFRPEARQVFDLPYIPIPADKMKHKYLSSGISGTMRDNVMFEKDGKQYVRYFIHPLYADKYKELIETYGIRYGEYQAASTSSPRSLVTWKKSQPGKPIWVKVSLHAHLDYYTKRDANGNEKKVGISRVQSEKKAKRSALVNAAFNSAGRNNLARHRVDFMAEPASFVPGSITYKGRTRNFDRATIFRELPTSLTAPNAQTRYVPAFTFIKNMKSTLNTINGELRQQGKRPINPIAWMTKGLVEPLVRTYLHLGLEHGLQGELHTQNFLLEVNKKGVPTGKVMVKDLDGFRMDLDMRIRNGKSVKFLKHFSEPFGWAKHSATQGSSSNPAVLQGWFNKLIRNVNGFTTTRTVNGRTEKVYATPAGQLMVQLKKDFPEVMRQLERQAVRRDPSLQGNADKTTRKAVEQVFDLVARAQFRRQTGVRIPKEKWGYGQNKGLNFGLNKLRSELAAAQPGQNGGSREYGALKRDKRTWAKGSPKTFRYLGDGVIEGITARGKHAGYGVAKPDMTGSKLWGTRTRATHHLKNYSGKDFSGRRPFTSYFQSRRPARRR